MAGGTADDRAAAGDRGDDTAARTDAADDMPGRTDAADGMLADGMLVDGMLVDGMLGRRDVEDGMETAWALLSGWTYLSMLELSSGLVWESSPLLGSPHGCLSYS
jgi:hypothetical protein